MGRWFISKGMQELRRLNIIDAKYNRVSADNEKIRVIKYYKFLGLYDPIKINDEFRNLETLYGSKKVKIARSYAKVVFKENSPYDVKALIELMDQYGQDPVKKAVNIVRRKAVDNPHRCIEYLIGMVKRLE